MHTPQQITLYRQSSEEVYFPLEELITLLLHQGFQVKPDNYLEMLKVLSHADTALIGQLKYQLCPLVATSEEEQLLFYRVFDKYVTQITEKGTTKPVKKTFLERYWLLLLVALAMLLLPAIYFYYQLPRYEAAFNITINHQANKEKSYAIIGDTIYLDATPSFEGKKMDISNVRISWNTGNGWVNENQLKTTFINTTNGEYLVRLKVESGLFMKQVTVDSQYIHSCKQVLDGMKTNKESPLQQGDSIVMEPLFRGEDQLPRNQHWIVNQDTLMYTGNQLIQHFDSTGVYTIDYVLLAVDGNVGCSQHQSKEYNIKKAENNITMDVLTAGPAIPPVPYRLNVWVTWMLCLLPLGAALLYFWLYIRIKRNKNQPPGDKDEESPSRPPYEVPMENKELQQIAHEKDMNALFTAMRRKVEDDTHVLNVPQTIHQMVRSGGVPSLVFTNRLKQRAYLILIDRANVKSQQLRLFEYLVRLLKEEDISIERFYYTTFNDFFNNEYPSGVSLQKLAEHYKSSTVLIFGNAQQLIYPAYPAVEKEKLQMLGEWEYKAILTPENYRDWGIREKTLKQHFILLPADIRGQLQLMQAIRENQLSQDKYMSTFQDAYDVGSWSFTDVDEIQKYLDDDTLFQWLCAICVYPKIRWEIITGIGEAILLAAGELRKLNFTNLLKLVRIKWMQEGIFPERTRLELLKKLSIPNELLARERVLLILEYSDPQTRPEYFFEEEKRQQQLINKFVVFANTRKSAYQSSYDAFRKLWETNTILDAPVKRYLDKKEGDDWATPLLQDNKNVGIDDFFNIETKISNTAFWRRTRKYNYIPVIIILVSALLLIFKNQLFNNEKGKELHLATVDTKRIYEIDFQLKTNDTCQQASGIFSRTINGELVTINKIYSLNFYNGIPQKLNLTLAELQSVVKLRLKLNDTIWSWYDNILITRKNISFQLRGICNISAGKKKRISLLYNNIILLPQVRRLEKILSDNYQVNVVLKEFSDSSRVVYFSNTEEALVSTLTSIIRTTTGKRLIPQLSNRSVQDPTVAAIYLYDSTNLAVCQPININDLPTALAEIWEYDNGLLRIDLDKYVVYSKNNNGEISYQIDYACVQQNIFRINVKEASKKILSLLIASDNEGNFELSFCDDANFTNDRITSVNKCTEFSKLNPHTPVYQSNDSIIDFQLNSLGMSRLTRLAETYKRNEIRSIAAIVHIYKQENTSKKYLINSVVNSFVSKLTKSNIPVHVDIDSIGQDPFQPNYISIRLSRILPNCNRTFYSLEDANRIGDPLLVCKLDLSKSKVKVWAKELYIYKNLRNLIFKREIISDAEIAELNQVLPDCKISVISDEKETTLGTLTIDDQGNPDYRSKQVIKEVASRLKSHPNAKIKLVSVYHDDRSLSKINTGIKIIKILFHRAGLSINSQQVEKEVYLVRQPVESNNNTINVIGINMP